jgi:uncharacterized protein involved in cysteine biosynthesis
MMTGWIDRSRRRTRVAMVLVGVPIGIALVVLGLVSWNVASHPADRTTGLVAQVQMLVAVVQGVLALALTVTTIFYAGRTGEMVEALHRSATASVVERERLAIDRLVEAAIDVAVQAGAIARLQLKSWRWVIPGRQSARNDLLVPMFLRITESVAGSVKAAGALRVLTPAFGLATTKLSDAIAEAFDAAVQGDLPKAERSARQIHDAAATLRAELGQT